MRDCVSPIVEPPSFELLVSVISAKERVNRPSFNKPFALENEIYQQETIVSLFLAGRFFVVPEQVLGRTYTFAYEVASGFFMSGCCFMRRIVNPPRPPNASARQFKHITYIKCRKPVFPEG